MHFEEQHRPTALGRHCTVEPGDDIVAQRSNRLTHRRQSEPRKQPLEIIGHTVFVEFRPASGTTHRIDAGNRDKIAECGGEIEFHIFYGTPFARY